MSELTKYEPRAIRSGLFYSTLRSCQRTRCAVLLHPHIHLSFIFLAKMEVYLHQQIMRMEQLKRVATILLTNGFAALGMLLGLSGFTRFE